MASFFSRLKGRLHLPWFGSGIGSVLVPILGLCLLFLPVGRGLRNLSYDLPFLLRAGSAVTNVVVVSLNETSIGDLKQDKSSFDRSLHAQLFRRLMDQGATVVVFDIEFIDPMTWNTNGTALFASAIQGNSNNVVIAAQYKMNRNGGAPQRNFKRPVEPLGSAAPLGVDNINPGTDFFAREHMEPHTSVPSLSWKAAALVNADITRSPDRRLEERWLNYYSPEPFRIIPFVDVISNTPLPTGFSFTNKVIFVGEVGLTGYAGEEKEELRYPWTRTSGSYFHGVQIHALTFSNLVRGDWLRRLPPAFEALVVVLVGAGLGYGLSLLRPLWVTLTAVLIALFVAACAYLLFARFNIWFPWLIIVAAQVPMTIGWAYLVDSIRTYVEKQLLETSLELYLSPKQVKEILKQPELLKPGASEKTVSILFSDIANFSKASEILPPSDLVNLLNEYYRVAIEAVHQTGGTVMNLIGDAIFAIWNAPQEQKDHQRLCCEAARLLDERVVQFNAGGGSIMLRTRIGLHTGIACVGNIGSPTHFDYAAIGESVNMASRLEGLNKKLKTNILATREIQSSLNGALVSRFVGNFKFKGLLQVNQVHEILGPPEMDAGSREWRRAFEDALRCWKERQFRKAEEHFRRTLQLRPRKEYAADDDPTDGPSDFYLKLIPEFISNPPPAEWLGEVDLRDK